MTIKKVCQCFLCRHKGEPRLCRAYLQGYIESCEWFINWAQKNNVKVGLISQNDLMGLYAQILCNHDDCKCVIQDYPDIG